MHRPAMQENLLFLVLAVQNEIISREQMASALKAWSNDQSKRIADALVEARIVSPEHRAALDVLTARQLERTVNGDGLLHSSAITQVLESIRAAADGEFRDSLRDFLGEESSPNDATQSYTKVSAPASNFDFDTVASGNADRFRIVRPHAKGGLGEVFLARDEELDREVALKEIQPRFAKDHNSFVRFVVEARVTGGLEHPGVVPIYGFGRYADGRPYYAMRFIRGESLKEAVDRFHRPSKKASANKTPEPLDPATKRLTFRNLLRRFIDACYAVGYAHNRGVLHRDLKPANIMLGKFGETMVVDWGLAKVIGRKEMYSQSDEATLMPTSGSFVSETLQGNAMGTPAYMPPEQAEGRVEDMGPGSDVYSLGATLYSILTGKPAFEGDTVQDVLTKVRENRFLRPREVNAEVPAALDAICRRAMQRNPEDRYPSTLALAADVEHWLADEPVSAYSEPLVARAGRWLRRHRTAAAALAVLLVTGVVASSVGIYFVNAERNRTHLAWTEVSKEQEKTSAALASESKARTQTRNALDTVTDDLIGEMMARRAALTDADRDYFERVLKQFSALTQEQGEEVEARTMRAEGFTRVANLRRRLGDWDAAGAAYRDAKAMWTTLVAEVPEKSAYKRELAATLANEGLLLFELGKYQEAVANYDAARAPLESLIAENAEDHKAQWNLALLIGNRANALARLADFDKAEADYMLALEKLQSAYMEMQSGPFATQQYARIVTNYAALLVDRGRREKEAEGLYRQAIIELEKLVKKTKNISAFRQDLANAKGNLGKLLQSVRRHSDALAELQPAATVHADLSREFPVFGVHRQELAKTRTAIGAALASLGRKESTEEFAAAETELLQLIKEQPKQPELKRDLASSIEAKGVALLGKKAVEAMAAFRKAADIRKEVAAAEPANDVFLLDRLATEINIANLLRSGGRFAEAGVMYRLMAKEVEGRQSLPARTVRQVRFGLGDCLMHTNEFTEALACWEQLTENRADPDWAKFELQRAIASVRVGRLDEGLAAAERVLARPQVEPVLYYDVACCCALAAEGNKNRPADAERLAQQAMKHLQQAAQAGFFKEPRMRAHAKTDTDLDNLRGRADFKAFAQRTGFGDAAKAP